MLTAEDEVEDEEDEENEVPPEQQQEEENSNEDIQVQTSRTMVSKPPITMTTMQEFIDTFNRMTAEELDQYLGKFLLSFFLSHSRYFTMCFLGIDLKESCTRDILSSLYHKEPVLSFDKRSGVLGNTGGEDTLDGDGSSFKLSVPSVLSKIIPDFVRNQQTLDVFKVSI